MKLVVTVLHHVVLNTVYNRSSASICSNYGKWSYSGDAWLYASCVSVVC